MDNAEDSFWTGLQLDGAPTEKFKDLYSGDFFIYYRPLDVGPRFIFPEKCLALKVDSNSAFFFECNMRIVLGVERINTLLVIPASGVLEFDVGTDNPKIKRS